MKIFVPPNQWSDNVLTFNLRLEEEGVPQGVVADCGFEVTQLKLQLH